MAHGAAVPGRRSRRCGGRRPDRGRWFRCRERARASYLALQGSDGPPGPAAPVPTSAQQSDDAGQSATPVPLAEARLTPTMVEPALFGPGPLAGTGTAHTR